jgi:3-dehydrotetronate 4-kinase
VGILLGCIADDFTGATDLCNTLVKGGMRAVQLIGAPAPGYPVPDADVVTIALKSRTCPVRDAIDQSLDALAWLRRAGARQILFKYCSTFDSTPKGNIGPVADALMDALGTDLAVVCPAFPETGRTIYHGHLFVGEKLLADTHMRHHPLTPMTESNLVLAMGAQTTRRVGLVPFAVVDAGPEAIADRFAALRKEAYSYAVTDAVADRHLLALGEAMAGHALITGGSGIALGLPENFRKAGLLEAHDATALPAVDGYEAVLAGSCSAATLDQIDHMAKDHPALKLDPFALADGYATDLALDWAREHLGRGPVLIYASAPAEDVAEAQQALGRDRAGTLVEDAMAAIAEGLVRAGVRRLVVAGGETSGAVVKALRIAGLAIGPQIDPGVPACVSLGDRPLALALKSGNFGAVDFLTKAFGQMPGERRRP